MTGKKKLSRELEQLKQDRDKLELRRANPFETEVKMFSTLAAVSPQKTRSSLFQICEDADDLMSSINTTKQPGAQTPYLKQKGPNPFAATNTDAKLRQVGEDQELRKLSNEQ